MSVTPYLCIRGAGEALSFYAKAFGAEELMRMADPSGKVMHAEMRIGDSLVMLADEFPDFGILSPATLGGTPVLMAVYVEDVDAFAKRAVAEGAEVVIPVADQPYGDRAGRLKDPYGHLWIVATHQGG
jgi:PhnB protein